MTAKACGWCKKVFEAVKANKQYCCETCRRAAKYKRNKDWEANNPEKVHREPCVIILDDPDKLGGFPTGAEVSRISMRYMLEMCVCTPGMIVQDGRTKYQIVECKGRQEKVRM